MISIYRYLFAFLLSTLLYTNALAQDILARHTVKKGETITQIAQKYRITPYDIYKVNPNAQNGIKENDVILIPAVTVGATKPPADTKVAAPDNSTQNPGTHTAKAKETLFSIARLYNVTVDELRAANPILSEGLKVGQVIKIPGKGTTPTNTAATTVSISNGKSIVHIVESKETKFGIAKRYGISVAELERQNPGIVQGLQVGYKLTISGGTDSGGGRVTTEVSQPQQTPEPITSTVKGPFANYEVKPKETMFSLTQMFGITEAELIGLNPELREGVKIGMILKVPARGSIIPEQPVAGNDLIKGITRTEKKKLVLLLPFNAAKIQNDSVRSLAERLKKDAFLNMTLDFYSGALMAIDSAKTLGLNIDVQIYDSAESKNSSNVSDIVTWKNLKEADAIIGPFYQQYAEKVAEMLSSNNVPVISPMSKEAGKPMANLYQAMPSEEFGKRAIFEYMMSKNGNIIVISDPKRAANREFITQNFPETRFADLEDNGGLNSDKLKAMFVKDRINYVILDSERTGMILSATNFLLNETATYNIQLAIIEPNETLDFEEISMKRLTILKMLYPSMTRENQSPEAIRFENAYKRENKIFPNQYAVRGFDVTFDTMLRLSQGKEFVATVTENKSEGVESKFNYVRNEGEGFLNKGVYILQYNEDLSVKEAE